MLPKIIGATLAIGLCVGAASAQGDFIDSQALREAGLSKYWQLPLPLFAGQELAYCYLEDDQIYAATADGYVYAVDAQTGALRWMTQITTAGYEIRRPCHIGNLVCFVLPSAMIFYDRYSGTPVRMIETRFATGSAAVSDGARFYVGGIDQKLYAFSPAVDFEIWKTRADGQVVSRPALMGEYLYFVGDRGTVYACTAANKRFYWKSRRPGSVIADLATDDNGVYVASLDYSLYLLDPAFGGLRWRTRFSGPLTEPPVLTPKVAYQYSSQDGLVAVNAETVGVQQRVRWTVPNGRSVLTVDGNSVYIFTVDRQIIEVDVETGRIAASIPAPGFEYVMPTTRTVALLLASKDGRLFCARKQGVPIVLADEVRRALKGPETAAADTRPAAESTADTAKPGDVLTTRRPGPPLGGKSKVTKEFESGRARTQPE